MSRQLSLICWVFGEGVVFEPWASFLSRFSTLLSAKEPPIIILLDRQPPILNNFVPLVWKCLWSVFFCSKVSEVIYRQQIGETVARMHSLEGAEIKESGALYSAAAWDNDMECKSKKSDFWVICGHHLISGCTERPGDRRCNNNLRHSVPEKENPDR